MANTQSVMGATVEELEALTAAARKAGEETVFKASQAADALYNLGQAGMDASQAIDALDGVLTLAVASQSELAFTAEVVVSTLNQFGLAANEASRVANVFAAANAESLAELDMLAASLKNAGPVAATFGYSLEETVAALMALYNAGFQGEQAGNMLKRAISDLANPVGDAVNVLSELGFDRPGCSSRVELFGRHHRYPECRRDRLHAVLTSIWPSGRPLE
jgi:TP901 family phage tail tape measure protein